MKNQLGNLLVTAIALSIGPLANATLVTQVDDFQDGTKQNWGASSQDLMVVDNGGERFLEYSSNGFGGPNSRMVIPVISAGHQWVGDYVGAGITGFSVDVANPGNADLNLWLSVGSGMFSSDGSWFTSDTPVSLPAGSGFRTIAFSVLPEDLVFRRGAETAEQVLATVNQLRISSSAGGQPTLSFGGGGSPQGDTVAASIQIDNFRAIAIPEPAGIVLLCVGSGFIRRRR